MRSFLFFILLSANSFGATPEEIRNLIQGQMSQRHPENSSSFWAGLGSEALPVIKQMYGETKSAYEKSWLIDGMGYFSDPSVGSVLEGDIQGSTNNVMTKKMLSALIQSQGASVYTFVEPYLKNEDPHIRLAVAENMNRYMDTDQARQRYLEFQAQEKLAWVKDELKKEEQRKNAAHLKRGDNPLQAKVDSPAPLSEKSQAGEWKGQLIGPKVTPGSVFLTLLHEKASSAEQKWKVEMKLERQSKFEIKGKDLEVVYYQTSKTHWIEVRNKKDDQVFIGQRQ